MKRDWTVWFSPIVALAVLVAVGLQTNAALRVTGAFGSGGPVADTPMSPAFRTLEAALDRQDPGFTLEGLRDPFRFSRAVADTPPAAPDRTEPRPRTAPAVEARPVLTAILFDDDPRALIRWKDREWTIRQGGLFDEFVVVGITRDQVTLRRGETSIVLRRTTPGDRP
ncbi:MAG: hypothetical protein ACKOC6_09135 [bacterium]